MSNLINTYPVFESSQVLTSSQLNQVVSYLDQQSRLTRVKLIGMGIVCGLELTYEESGADTQIIISKGTAVTSEGFLVTLGHCDTSWYRPYNLPEGVAYKPFGDPTQDVTLYELLKDLPDDTSDVEELDNSDGFLDDKFVLLFLETFDNDLKSCLGNTCDELGIDRILTVRKLLISQDDLDLVLTRSANVGEQYPDKYELPDVVMPRTLFDPDDTHSQDYADFSEHYASTFVDSVFPALFGDDSNPGALSESYSAYDLLLGPEYDFANPFETTSVENLMSTWSDFLDGTASPGPAYRGIQYFSDFLKDLILAYDEFRETAFDLMSECCPDMSLFPKHVMLGRALVPSETPEEATTYRHGFTQPPIYNHQKYLIEKTIALHKRMVLMVETFNLDRINNPDTEGEAPQPLRITPSDEKNTPLSERSIPYYYNSKEEVAIVGEGTLEQHWNFDITRKKLPGTPELTLSYENQAEDQSAIVSPLETPLYYDLDSYPFLRVEGHIGHDYEDVISQINDLKTAFDLPFDTVALQLDPDASLLELDYSCGFEDLQEEYAMARNRYCGFIEDLVRLFEFAMEHRDTIFGDSEETSEDLERVSEILESLQQLCDEMTDCLHEFDFEAFQESYKTALQLILDFVLVEKELLNEINVDEEDAEEELPIINGMIQRLSPLLFKIVDMLFYNTFLRVYYGFQRREFYLQRETAVFSRYIRRHPGVQHQAGVLKGGTFIIVYNNSEDQTVIADFNLPYLCCGTDHCVPMCDEEDSDFVFDAPPLARPDYAITTIGTPVEIDVSLNDYGFWNAEFSVESEEESEHGGRIEQLSEEGLLRYIPDEEFTGYDRFQYAIGNRETGAEDQGTVTVLVKGREVEAGCYSIEILECWGIELVRVALRNRDINPSDMTQDQMLETLLQSLRETAGFTLDEIRFNTLEGEESRRHLLNCIGIEINANTSYQELERLIVDYQNERCGEGQQPVEGCYSPEILECWGIEFVKLALQNRDLLTGDMSEAQMIDTLHRSLQESGGFSQDEIRFNTLEGEESRRRLLECIGIRHDDSTTYQQLEELIVRYQNENCGGQQPVEGCYSREILTCWGMKSVQLALNTRDIDASDMSEEQMMDTLLESLRDTGGFTQNEIRTNILESEQSRRQLLTCLKIPHTEDTSYQQLEQLIVEYQNEHCGEGEVPCTVTEVTGIVLSPEGEPLPGVNIVVEGTRRGTTTNADGKFSLDLGEPGQTLVVSFVGFQTQRVEVCNEPELEIVLQAGGETGGVVINPDLIATEEIVNVLGVREASIEETENRDRVLKTLGATERGNTFSQEELQLLKNDTLKKVLEAKDISFAVNDTKDVLIRKLMKG